MPKSTGKSRSRKGSWHVRGFRIKRPFKDFPLTPHYSGKWMKKIRRELVYFGCWGRVVNRVFTRVENDGWAAALELYKAQADDLLAGRTPRGKSGEGVTVMDLCNQFLTTKKRKLAAGEMSARMFAEYRATTDRLIAAFGKKRLVADLDASDFEKLRADLAKQYGPVRLGNEITKVKTVFKYAGRRLKIAVDHGEEFKKPGKDVMRKHRAKVGARLFTADELRRLIEAASVPMKAMLLLGINAGFGNTDCGQLPKSALDLDNGWVMFPRPKTGIERRCPLWPETIAALKAMLAERPEANDDAHADLVFITKYGRPWAQDGTSDAVTQEMGKLLRRLEIDGRRGRGLYSARHTFRTVADATKDPNAIRLIMGHTDDSIDANYTHGIDDARLIVVSDHVRSWLFPKPADKAKIASLNAEQVDAAPATIQPTTATIKPVEEKSSLRLFVAEAG